MDNDQDIPAPGHWPVDPQEDVPVSKDRIWVDGCFDFSHHGKREFPQNYDYAAQVLILLHFRRSC